MENLRYLINDWCEQKHKLMSDEFVLTMLVYYCTVSILGCAIARFVIILSRSHTNSDFFFFFAILGRGLSDWEN